MIDMIYIKKDVIISTSTESGKSLPYQLIPLIKKKAIVPVILPIISLMTNQVYLSVINFHYKL